VTSDDACTSSSSDFESGTDDIYDDDDDDDAASFSEESNDGDGDGEEYSGNDNYNRQGQVGRRMLAMESKAADKPKSARRDRSGTRKSTKQKRNTGGTDSLASAVLQFKAAGLMGSLVRALPGA
jgi:hypothetical protein